MACIKFFCRFEDTGKREELRKELEISEIKEKNRSFGNIR